MASLLTIAEVQRILSCSRATIYRLRDRQALRLVHLGRAARVPREDVDKLLANLIR